MTRWLFLLAGALPFALPAQDLAAVAARHARISALYEAGDHAGVIREVEAQLRDVPGTPYADSLHRYLYKFARAQRKVNGPEAGIAAGERILGRVRERGAARNELEALLDLSWVYYEAGQARECARVDSLAVLVADADPSIPFGQKGRARQYLAFDHSILGDHERSAHWAREALKQYGRADSVPAIQWAEAYTAVGVACWHLGRIREAEGQYARALEVLDDRTDEASIARRGSTYGNLGVLWQSAGDLPRALAYYQDALRQSDRLVRTTSDAFTRDEAIVSRSRTYLNLSTVYFELGDHGRARELLDLCWRDRSSVLAQDDPQLIAVKERFADLELGAGDAGNAYPLQLEYVRSAEERFGRSSEEYIRAAIKLGSILVRQGRYMAADSLFTRSIAACQESRDPAIDPELARCVRERASMRARQGRWEEARTELQRARTILEGIHGSAHHQVAEVEIQLAEVAFEAGDPRGALGHAEEALRILNARVRAARSDPLPQAFPAPRLLPDAVYWKVRASRALAPAGHADGDAWNADLDLAITALARNRSAVQDAASRLHLMAAQKRLFELAQEVAHDAYAEAPSPDRLERFLHLAEADRSVLLKARLNTFAGLRYAGLPDSLVAREQELIQALAIDADHPSSALGLDRREAELRDLLRMLAEQHPRYFALRHGEPTVTLKQVREKLVTPQRPLLAYTAHEEHLYILVIRSDTAILVRTDGKGLAADVRAFNEAIGSRDAVRGIASAHRLHQRLIAPVADALTGGELLIIPDGPLHQVSFEALVDAPCVPSRMSEHVLLRRYAIAYLLSATTAVQFADLARERTGRTLALAPGFTDEVKRNYVERIADSTRIDRRFLSYVRQPFALSTAAGLGRSWSATLLLGSAASEQALRDRAADHGVIHLGTHAELHPSDPMYARLVLSKGGAEGGTDDDGYLHAYEIYELDLRAQLAVLTACETGSGREDVGEGVRSIGHSFAYAGCPSLVMALWSIDEKVSSEIVTRFYEHLADGLSKHEALRLAKLEHLDAAKDELLLPYYWAGLVLVGDVRPVQFEQGFPWIWLVMGVGACLALWLGWRWWPHRRRSTR